MTWYLSFASSLFVDHRIFGIKDQKVVIQGGPPTPFQFHFKLILFMIRIMILPRPPSPCAAAFLF
jgi:hypothetical protein